MSTPFLLRFSSHLVTALKARELVELAPGQDRAVIHGLADHLTGLQHASLISSVVSGLLGLDGVEELYATNEELKALVEEMEARVIRG